MRRSSEETRAHVLRVTRELFYRHGIRTTGVDRVATEAGVAPTTLYRLFASKDDLVAGYLEREAEGYRDWFTAAIGAPGSPPRERILALFDALTVQVRGEDCRGCPFQIGIAELADPALPGHVQAVGVKRWTRDQLHDLAVALAVPDPAVLAGQLMLVFEGVYASVLSLADDAPVAHVRSLVTRLLDPVPDDSDVPPVPAS